MKCIRWFGLQAAGNTGDVWSPPDRRGSPIFTRGLPCPQTAFCSGDKLFEVKEFCHENSII